MKRSVPSPADKPTEGGADERARGETVPSQAGSRRPRLPHEHDASSDSQSSAAPSIDEAGQHAFDDVRSGKVDTDRGPLMERTYRRVKQPKR